MRTNERGGSSTCGCGRVRIGGCGWMSTGGCGRMRTGGRVE
jgi:hypothetical protein